MGVSEGAGVGFGVGVGVGVGAARGVLLGVCVGGGEMSHSATPWWLAQVWGGKAELKCPSLHKAEAPFGAVRIWDGGGMASLPETA